jgi:2-keto-4-pentenoate hydratase/2-oxohepta-3-ene-1,7-dioic acid hydratase in catechol pathway
LTRDGNAIARRKQVRLASFETSQGLGFGIVDGGEVLDVAGQDGTATVRGLAELLGTLSVGDIRSLGSRSGVRRNLQDLRFLPPITDSERILCIGLNFTDHALEAKLPIPEQPSFFVRFRSSFVGHERDIVAPSASSEFDFEGEIALVIGKAGYHIAPSRALDHVLGLTILADNSARDWQRHSRQVTAGKNFPASGSIGPWCVTLDEVADLRDLSIETRLNGATVQHGNTRDLIFAVEQAVTYASSFTPLTPGDLIALGTPAGVGMARTPPLWLKPGDRLEIEVPGIGTLANRVIAESHINAGKPV